MSDRNVVRRVFDDFGHLVDAEKKSGSWYVRGPEVTAVLNLQKSQYGPQYYFNLGLWFPELDGERYPKPEKSHVVLRLNDALPRWDRRIDELLDLERELGEAERGAELRSLFENELRPLLARAATVAGVRELVAEGPLAHAGIRAPAQMLLFGRVAS